MAGRKKTTAAATEAVTETVEPTTTETVTAAATEAVTETVEPTFTKQQLLRSRKWVNRRDALNALLSDGVSYTEAQVKEALNNFYKRKVK